MKKFVIVIAFLAIVLPSMASAADAVITNSGAAINPGTDLSSCRNIASNGISGVVSCLIGFMNNAMYLIMAAAVLYIVWGAFELIREEGEKRDEAKNKVLYGIIGLFVMVSVWGLVNILSQTFNLTAPAQKPTALTP